MQDMIIIGNGPAGLSAALYLLRAGFSVTIIGKDNGALSKAEKIENYFGLPVPQDGNTLVENGKKQVAELGATLLEEEVVGISWNGNYQITTTDQTLESRSLLLATGSPRKRPPIPGLKELEGKGVSYCAVCDAFFYRGKDVAVLGNGEYAVHEAQELLPLAGSVTLLTNGTEPLAPLPEGLQVDMRPIERLEGNPTLQEIHFTYGSSLPMTGLFVALGSAKGSDLAKKLGLLLDNDKIVVDQHMQTNMPGCFAAGDCIGGILQISVAVGEGAKAGLTAIRYLRTGEVLPA